MTTTDPRPASDLSDLPLHRQWLVAWQTVNHEDWPDVEKRFDHLARQRCRHSPYDDRATTAHLGDDGRYHLVDLYQRSPASCASRATTVGFAHRFSIGWWTDGASYRVHPPSGNPNDAGYHNLGLEHHVRLDDRPVDPGLVLPAHRCPQTMSFWPGYRGDQRRDRLTTLRRTLVDHYGPWCAVCTIRWGVVLDHDHRSGLVRGLLCRWCNGQVDLCVDVSGCPYAGYLDNSPALALTLDHPGHKTMLNTANYRDRQQRLGPWWNSRTT